MRAYKHNTTPAAAADQQPVAEAPNAAPSFSAAALSQATLQAAAKTYEQQSHFLSQQTPSQADAPFAVRVEPEAAAETEPTQTFDLLYFGNGHAGVYFDNAYNAKGGFGKVNSYNVINITFECQGYVVTDAEELRAAKICGEGDFSPYEEYGFTWLINGSHGIITINTGESRQTIMDMPFYSPEEGYKEVFDHIVDSTIGGTIPLRCRFAREMINELLRIHSLGVLSRDIKLENFMAKQDSTGIVEGVIIDFGLSTVADNPTLKMCGSPAYVAPEVFMTSKSSTASDVFSLGHCLFPLFAPYRGMDLQNLNTQILIKYAKDEKQIRHATAGNKERRLRKLNLLKNSHNRRWEEQRDKILLTALPDTTANSPHTFLRELISKMTAANPEERCTLNDALTLLTRIENAGVHTTTATAYTDPTHESPPLSTAKTLDEALQLMREAERSAEASTGAGADASDDTASSTPEHVEGSSETNSTSGGSSDTCSKDETAQAAPLSPPRQRPDRKRRRGADDAAAGDDASALQDCGTTLRDKKRSRNGIGETGIENDATTVNSPKKPPARSRLGGRINPAAAPRAFLFSPLTFIAAEQVKDSRPGPTRTASFS